MELDSLKTGVFRDVTIDAVNLVGAGGTGRIGRERLGCTGITQEPRSFKAVARLLPARRSLLELSVLMIRDSGKKGKRKRDWLASFELHALTHSRSFLNEEMSRLD